MSETAFSLLSVQNVSASSVTYGLPQLKPGLKRRVFEMGTVKGHTYSIVGLNPGDAESCYALCEAEYDLAEKTGKSYLLRRSLDEIQHMMDFDRKTRQGGIIIAAVLDDNRLGAIGAVDLIDDEKDAGRGSLYDVNGACPLEQQIYFKMAVVHPALRDEKLELPKMLYPYRLAVGLWFEERQCFLTKASGANVKKAYTKFGWKCVDSYRLPEADDPAYDLTEDEKVLNTYLLSREQATQNLCDKYEHVYKQFDELKAAFSDFTNYKNTVAEKVQAKLIPA